MRFIYKEMSVTVDKDSDGESVPSFWDVLGQPNGFRVRVSLILEDHSDRVIGVNVLPLGKED